MVVITIIPSYFDLSSYYIM